MKLNDFIHKKPYVKKAPTQFVIENEVLEQKYQDQINALDLELARYKTMESERDEAIRKSGVDREKSRLFENENSVLSQEITLLKTTIDDQESGVTGHSKHWQKMRDNLSWFMEHNAKAYMVLLD